MYTVSEQPKEQTRKGNEFISGTWMQPIKINVTSSCKLTKIILQPFCIVMENSHRNISNTCTWYFG